MMMTNCLKNNDLTVDLRYISFFSICYYVCVGYRFLYEERGYVYVIGFYHYRLYRDDHLSRYLCWTTQSYFWVRLLWFCEDVLTFSIGKWSTRILIFTRLSHDEWFVGYTFVCIGVSCDVWVFYQLYLDRVYNQS